MDLRYSRLTTNKRNRLLEFFVAGATARSAAAVLGVNRNTARLFFHRLRVIIAEEQEKLSPFIEGEVEVDESYFGGRRKGKRGRGAAGKVPVFGLLKRGGKVYTQVIPDAKAATLMPIIKDRIAPDSIVYSAIPCQAIMPWISQTSAIAASTTPGCLLINTITSTVLKTSGIRPNATCASSTVYPNKTSISSSKNVSSGLTTPTTNNS